MPGPRGEAGLDGPPGIKGEAGVKGYSGDYGGYGVNGRPGDPGVKGAAGQPGLKGLDGLDVRIFSNRFFIKICVQIWFYHRKHNFIQVFLVVVYIEYNSKVCFCNCFKIYYYGFE